MEFEELNRVEPWTCCPDRVNTKGYRFAGE